MEITVCFTGNRPQNLICGFNEMHPVCLKIKLQLKRIIEGLITKKNATHFISGAALGVDMWAMESVLELKKIYPHIILEAAIPCRSQSCKWKKDYKEKYQYLLSQCDKVTLLQDHYTADCMQKRNEYMVESSDYIVAVWNRQPSGTKKTIKYAINRGKPVYCINAIKFKMFALN